MERTVSPQAVTRAARPFLVGVSSKWRSAGTNWRAPPPAPPKRRQSSPLEVPPFLPVPLGSGMVEAMNANAANSCAAPAEEPTDLESVIRRGIQEIESGECITVTVEQLERWATTGESPWPDESTD